MILDSTRLTNFPILSLHTGSPIGRISSVVVDPNDLKIIAFCLDGGIVGTPDVGDILMVKDIREFSGIGIIIDSSDDLVAAGDVIRLDEILKLEFQLENLKVVTKKGNHLGRVSYYTFNPATFEVMQFIVKRPLLKSFLDPELTIGRSEVVEVDDEKIIIKDERQKQNAVGKDFVPNFVNPFRDTTPAKVSTSSTSSSTKTANNTSPSPKTVNTNTNHPSIK